MAIGRKVRVLIVDDSMFFREFLSQGLSADKGIEIVGFATDPYEAKDKIIELEPDIMTLDVEMPKMSGIEFLKKLMPQHPLPVVVVSSATNAVFDAMNAGAVDFIAKPSARGEEDFKRFMSELIVKVKIASTAKVKTKGDKGLEVISHATNRNDNLIIAIGASTGGTEAIFSILKVLPKDIPGIVIVQHMPPVFTKMYSERLNNYCPIEVKEAEDGDIVTRGKALIAAGDFHMKLVKEGGIYRVRCMQGDKVSGHCPSVDVLFDSVAEKAGSNAIGVILTGMGSDGAKGLLKMKEKGAYTIGQDEKSCVVYGMPMVAYNLGAVNKQLPLDRIHEEIINQWAKRTR